MTRKDYVAVARSVTHVEDVNARRIVVEALADYYERAYRNFKRDLFIKACGVQSLPSEARTV